MRLDMAGSKTAMMTTTVITMATALDARRAVPAIWSVTPTCRTMTIMIILPHPVGGKKIVPTPIAAPSYPVASRTGKAGKFWTRRMQEDVATRSYKTAKRISKITSIIIMAMITVTINISISIIMDIIILTLQLPNNITM
jgi:hypothetical protein